MLQLYFNFKIQIKCVCVFVCVWWGVGRFVMREVIVRQIVQPVPGSEIVVKSRSVKRNAKNARGLGRDRASLQQEIKT